MTDNAGKLRLLYVYDILTRKADADNPVSVEEFISELEKKQITAERKALYSDLAALREFGVDVVTVKSKSVGYYIKNKPLALDDLSTLWDAVHACDFISAKRCNELKKKLDTLAGEAERASLRRRIYTVNRSLRQPELFRETLNTVHNAIAEKKQLLFRYAEGTKTYGKPKKETYTVSPYIVTCQNGGMSLVAGCPELEGLNHFYIERMENAVICQTPSTDVREFVGDMEFDLMCYSRGLFDSYSPDSVSVTLQCGEEMLNTVIGTFGRQVDVTPCGGIAGGMYYATFDTEVSESLISWLFLNSATVSAVAPRSLVDTLKEAARDVYIKYCDK